MPTLRACSLERLTRLGGRLGVVCGNQILFPKSKNSLIMYRIMSNLLWPGDFLYLYTSEIKWHLTFKIYVTHVHATCNYTVYNTCILLWRREVGRCLLVYMYLISTHFLISTYMYDILASSPGPTQLSMLHAEKCEGLVCDVT